MVVELSSYRRYLSLSVFDMMHLIPAVPVAPTRPVVLRLAEQTSPLADAHQVVLGTVSGLLFLRTAVHTLEDEPEVLALAERIRTAGHRR